MSRFRHISIRAKLLGAALIAAGALLLVSLVGTLSLHQVHGELRSFAQGEFAAQSHLTALRHHMGQVRRYEKDALLNIEDIDAGKSYAARWRQALAAARQELAALGERPHAAQDVSVVLQRLSEYERQAGEVIQRGINGQIVTSTEANQALEPAKQAMYRAEPLVEQIASRVMEAAQARTEWVDEAALTRIWVIAAVACVALGVFVPAMTITVLSVTRPLDEAARFADQVASGDLTASLPVAGRDEISALAASMATMQRNLYDLVRQVRDTTDSITTASAEIAAGNQDLSTRTEQTASRLQQTAGAMEALTHHMVQSADTARQADTLASTASSVATRGSDVVSQVVSTMEDIHAASRKIADIISVIDGIAFQTNILALNAAVEAARAGEQGRGFAVVAGEVRQLAQRSAQAAREIKHLIHASVERVESGARLVASAGNTMGEITGSVGRVTTMMGDLARVAQEQRDGIGQVNSTIGQLDRMTQQNAALVEESAAAASLLKGQAHRLTALVDRFRIHAGRDGAAAHRIPITPCMTIPSATGSSPANAT